jgi:hypothetical protein
MVIGAAVGRMELGEERRLDGLLGNEYTLFAYCRPSESGKLQSLASSLQARTAATDRHGRDQPPELLDWFGDTVLAP